MAAKFLPEDTAIQDWGVTYEGPEASYDRFEYLCGTSGAGRQPPRRQPSRRQSVRRGARAGLSDAADEAGLRPDAVRASRRGTWPHSISSASGNLSQAYTNPLGVTLGPCTYCGFCEWFGCGNYSKASPQTAVLPVLLRKSNFEARTECEVMRINLDRSKTRAKSVTYVDTRDRNSNSRGKSFCCAPSRCSMCSACCSSGIGKPYDPNTGQGQIGRNYSYQTMSSGHRILRQDNIISTPSFPRVRSAPASTNTTATIWTTDRTASSAAAI